MKTYIREITDNNFVPHGWGNGYALIPPGHKLHGVDYNKIDVEVHCGLTFSRLIDKKMAEAWGMDADCVGCWMVGFDTCHLGDGPHLDRAFVQREAENLARQLETQK